MSIQPRFPLWLPVAGLLLAIVHLSVEHVSGGIKSHHLLNSADLPAISNWFELITLPLLAVMLGLSCRNQTAVTTRWAGVPVNMLPAFFGAMLYGAAIAISFALGAAAVTEVAFFGLFGCALLLPIYRVQFITGFVLTMTFTFGGVLPLIIAATLALLSWVSRFITATVVAWWRKYHTQPAKKL
jgi:hypothetical protein